MSFWGELLFKGQLIKTLERKNQYQNETKSQKRLSKFSNIKNQNHNLRTKPRGCFMKFGLIYFV